MLVSFVKGLMEEAESIYQDKFGKDEFPASAKRKLNKDSRTIIDDFCPGLCEGQASLMLIRQLARFQYDSLVLAYGFDYNANMIGTRFAVVANEAIKQADIKAGEESSPFQDQLAKYKELQSAVTELAGRRYEQLDKQRRSSLDSGAQLAQ